VHIVDIEHTFRPRDVLARPYSPRSTYLAVDELAAGFEQVFLQMLELAPRDLCLRRIGEDIRRTNRRINALEQQIIPRLEAQARFISYALEERARDEVIRLKRLKKKRAGKR
jgi:V/A-type H+-transporting ATPase subunit D